MSKDYDSMTLLPMGNDMEIRYFHKRVVGGVNSLGILTEENEAIQTENLSPLQTESRQIA